MSSNFETSDQVVCEGPRTPAPTGGLAEPCNADESWNRPLNFDGVEILAPMVRASTLPLRLECLRYGASLVYGEEIIDKKLLGAVRTENAGFGIIDYVSSADKVAVFSTCAEERSHVFCQLGTADAVSATQAATLVCRDVRGIDVNMGCPKSFSVKGGMGAALLDKPDVVCDILKSLRRNLPTSCALTCKIRMLRTTAQTRDFLQLCERSGAEAITVHMRTRDERPAEPAHWDEIMKLWDAVKVPVMANGDFFTRHQIQKFWDHCLKEGTDDAADLPHRRRGPSGLMIARGAMYNPSIFQRDGAVPDFDQVVQSYVQRAVATNSSYQNTKWMVGQLMAGCSTAPAPLSFRGMKTKVFVQKLGQAKSMASICELMGEPFDPVAYHPQAHTPYYYRALATPGGSVGAAPLKRRRGRRPWESTTGAEEADQAEEVGDEEREHEKDVRDEDEPGASKRARLPAE